MQRDIHTLNVQLNLGGVYYSLHVPNSSHSNWKQLCTLQYLSCENFLDLSEQLFPDVPINRDKYWISTEEYIGILDYYSIKSSRSQKEIGFHNKCTGEAEEEVLRFRKHISSLSMGRNVRVDCNETVNTLPY